MQPNLRSMNGKRLKGLDEFDEPEFVGRMARFERRRKLGWWGLMMAGFIVGGVIGWFLI